MSDKLEALSQPIGLVTNQLDGAVIVESDQLLPGDNVYSQEYVTALLAALERSTKNEHALGGLLDEMTRRRDSHANRANAAEQREEHLKATVDVLSAKNAELQQRLQQPIKLPDIRSEDYHESGWFQHMKYYRDVVRSIQVLELKVEGE
ncbi:hypothetical protein [Serratia fonticola]